MHIIEAMLLPPEVQALAEQAEQLRRLDQSSPFPDATEKALRKAYRCVEDDLRYLAQQTAAGAPIDYPALLGGDRDEKLAAMLLLAKYTLLDMTHLSREVLDCEYTHRNLAVLAEILFRTDAADALMRLFLFAQENIRRPTLHPRLWQNVSSHCLMLLTMMERQHARVVDFFADNKMAFEQLEQLVSFTHPAMIDRLLEDCQLRRRRGASPLDTPDYIRLYEQSCPDVPVKGVLGLCAFVGAQRLITKAFDDADMAEVIHWFHSGSALAAGEVLEQARTKLSAKMRVSFLASLIEQEQAPSDERVAAVICELCQINLAERPENGIGEVNRLLFETAMTEDEARLKLALLAVRALFCVKNADTMLVLAEQAPLLRIAEEALYCMKDYRRLPAIEPVVRCRPELRNAYFRAQQELQEVNWLMENVWTCEDDVLAQSYIDRLMALNAREEMEKIAKLAERKGHIDALRLARMK